MKNTHIEHPEDSILTGDLSVLDWFCSMKGAKASLKIDGAPAIVWGTNPATGNFFVGTKSVFNKKKLKINESHTDIDRNHPDEDLAEKLHTCFDYLPRTDEIYQGDFIGYGGDHTYQPNTLVYSFDNVIEHEIIIAPHTVYDCPTGKLSEAIASSLDYNLPDDSNVLFVRPNVEFGVNPSIIDKCRFARVISGTVTYATKTEARKIVKAINTFIRVGAVLDDYALSVAADCDINLIRLWKLIRSIKHDFMEMFEHDANEFHGTPFATFIYDGDSIQQIDGEGYVMWSDIGTYKLVDRELFSHVNFNQTQFGRV